MDSPLLNLELAQLSRDLSDWNSNPDWSNLKGACLAFHVYRGGHETTAFQIYRTLISLSIHSSSGLIHPRAFIFYVLSPLVVDIVVHLFISLK